MRYSPAGISKKFSQIVSEVLTQIQFSFASKYCTYHNVEVCGRDDYSIFDGIVKNTLPHYIQGLTTNKIDTWRRSFDYEAFNECVGKLLDENNIHIPFRRRKLDHFLWYANR